MTPLLDLIVAEVPPPKVDAAGSLLRYSAPEGKVKLEKLPLGPIEQFLAARQEPSRRLPILGPDPRNPEHEKVFSAAPIVERDNNFVSVQLLGKVQ